MIRNAAICLSTRNIEPPSQKLGHSGKVPPFGLPVAVKAATAPRKIRLRSPIFLGAGRWARRNLSPAKEIRPGFRI